MATLKWMETEIKCYRGSLHSSMHQWPDNDPGLYSCSPLVLANLIIPFSQMATISSALSRLISQMSQYHSAMGHSVLFMRFTLK